MYNYYEDNFTDEGHDDEILEKNCDNCCNLYIYFPYICNYKTIEWNFHKHLSHQFENGALYNGTGVGLAF